MKGVLEITTKIGCKVNCKYCPQHTLVHAYCADKTRKMELDIEKFKTMMCKVPTDIMIDFAGMSEPWLNAQCTEMIKFVYERGHKISILSTLVGMQHKDAEILRELKIEQFVIHIPDINGNSKIEVTEDYKEILKEILELKHVKNMSFSCHGEVHESIKEIIKTKSCLLDNTMVDRAGNLDNEDVIRKQVTGRCVCTVCGEDLNHNILLPDGTVLLCCMDYGMQHVLGNLLNEDYETILNGKEANRVREGMRNGNSNILCKRCVNSLEIEELIESYVKIKDNNDLLWNNDQWLIQKNQEIETLLENEAKISERNEKLNTEKDSIITELKGWLEQLENAKKYYLQQLTLKDKAIDELKDYAQRIDNEKESLSSQIVKNDIIYKEIQQQVTTLENSIDDLKLENGKLRYHLKLEIEKPWFKKIIERKRHEKI